MQKRQQILDGLRKLSVLPMPPRGYRTSYEIADACGCSHRLIQDIEKKALKKVTFALKNKIEREDLKFLIGT